MFDEKSRQALKYYVYMLLDPTDNKPFYVGKGIDNRVFNHLACALTDTDTSNAKYDKIREIIQSGQTVKHIGVDGCGAPLMSTTLVGLARAFDRATWWSRQTRKTPPCKSEDSCSGSSAGNCVHSSPAGRADRHL
jgi:hypothetical protein